ncbi:MAG TPA: magnesium transporter [Thermoanaerobaculia bacterium]|nr:magnesium transporter [Thermoanaerobaculia bacterium]
MTSSRSEVERSLARVLLEEQPFEAARLMENEPAPASAELLAGESDDVVLPILRRLTPERAAEVVAALPGEARRRTLSSLNHDRAAVLLSKMDDEDRERCLADLDESLAKLLRELLEYPPQTAGALMDPRTPSFPPDATPRDVVRHLRRHRERRVSDVLLVDEEGRLTGAIPLETIVLADQRAPLESLVTEPPVAVPAVASREEILQTFEALRVASLPVIDLDRHVLGVLRQRELMRAAQEQATASAVTMVGASEQERALSSPLFAVRKRLPWLQINLLTAFLAAAVVGLFEETIASVTALAVLLPVVAGQSGNAGAQALAVTMRALVLREISLRHWPQVLLKEAAAGLLNGLAVAATTALGVYLWSRSPGLVMVISLSMVISMVAAGIAGAMVPVLLHRFGQDPATASSIILTTVTDVVGFFSFLGIATLFASMLPT